jgi:hypothetical protein
MKAWPVHAIFAAILVGSLIVRGRVADVIGKQDNLEPGVLWVARSHGLAFRDYATIADTGRRALVFEAPGCAKPVRIILRLLTFEEEPFTLIPAERDYIRRYVYIDHTWSHPQRLAVWAQRIKYEVLATLGLTAYVPYWHLLQVELPRDCPVADAVDWRMAWRRDYLSGATTR